MYKQGALQQPVGAGQCAFSLWPELNMSSSTSSDKLQQRSAAGSNHESESLLDYLYHLNFFISSYQTFNGVAGTNLLHGSSIHINMNTK